MVKVEELKRAAGSGKVDSQLEQFELLAGEYMSSARWHKENVYADSSSNSNSNSVKCAWEEYDARLGYLRASGIYNYCINLCRFGKDTHGHNGELKDYYRKKISGYRKSIELVEESFLAEIEAKGQDCSGSRSGNESESQTEPKAKKDEGSWSAQSQYEFKRYSEQSDNALVHSEYRNLLQDIREKAANELAGIKRTNRRWEMSHEEEIARAKDIIDIHRSSINGIRGLLKKLFEEAEAALGEAPTEYAAVGFASSARGELTPYSDPDCGILIKKPKNNSIDQENSLSESSEIKEQEEWEEIKEYFRKLSYYVALKIVNIGETVLPLLGIKELNDYEANEELDTNSKNWFIDHATPFGFALDSLKPGASKWPLGNMHVSDKFLEAKEKTKENARKRENASSKFKGAVRYELIGTPEEIADYIRKGKEDLDSNLYLSSVLSNIVLMHTNTHTHTYTHNTITTNSSSKDVEEGNKLVKEYRGLVDKILTEGDRKEIGERLLEDDIERFPPVKIGDEKIIYNAKQGIYRFIESIVEAICFYYGIVEGTTWEKIEKLRKGVEDKAQTQAKTQTQDHDEVRNYSQNEDQDESQTKGQVQAQGVIGYEAEKNLKVALSIAMEIRLGTYIANNGKIEDIAAFRNLGSKIETHIEKLFRVSNSELERYFLTSIPLYRSVKHFFSNSNTDTDTSADANNYDHSYNHNNKDVALLDKRNHLYDGSRDIIAIIEHQFMKYEDAFIHLQYMDALFISRESDYEEIVAILFDSGLKVQGKSKDLSKVILGGLPVEEVVKIPPITIPYSLDEYFVDRQEEGQSLAYVMERLEEEKGVVLGGVGGVGKTTLSKQLGYEWVNRGEKKGEKAEEGKEESKDRAVWWFDPDYEFRFEEQVAELAEALGINLKFRQDREKTAGNELKRIRISPKNVQEIVDKLKDTGQEILFIFDNYFEPVDFKHKDSKRSRNDYRDTSRHTETKDGYSSIHLNKHILDSVYDNRMTLEETLLSEAKVSSFSDSSSISIVKSLLINLRLADNVKLLVSTRSNKITYENSSSLGLARVSLDSFTETEIENYLSHYEITLGDEDKSIFLKEFSYLPLQLLYIASYLEHYPLQNIGDLKESMTKDPCITVPMREVAPMLLMMSTEEQEFLMQASYLGSKRISSEVLNIVFGKDIRIFSLEKKLSLLTFDRKSGTLSLHEETNKLLRSYARCEGKEEDIIQFIGGKLSVVFKKSMGSEERAPEVSSEVLEAVYNFCLYMESIPGFSDYQFDEHSFLLDEHWTCSDLDSSILFKLGEYFYNKGVEQDYEEAVSWYRKAADQGNAGAQNNLGVMYESGRGVEQDYGKAVEWYSKAAEQGNANAQNNLGVMYELGRGVEQDYEEAISWFRKAADQGEAVAQRNLGGMYYNGRGVEQDYEVAVGWYREAADQGHAGAQNNLGGMYYNGRGVEQDYGKAVEWYMKAADQGEAEAQNNLGVMYESGRGVEQDYGKAEWYMKAADQGEAEAQRNLGWMYESGRGVEQDYEEAVSWFRKAAEQGNAYAQKNLKILVDNNLRKIIDSQGWLYRLLGWDNEELDAAGHVAAADHDEL